MLRYTNKTKEKASIIRMELFKEYKEVRDYVDFIDADYVDFLNFLGNDSFIFEEDDGWVILNEKNMRNKIQELY